MALIRPRGALSSCVKLEVISIAHLLRLAWVRRAEEQRGSVAITLLSTSEGTAREFPTKPRRLAFNSEPQSSPAYYGVPLIQLFPMVLLVFCRFSYSRFLLWWVAWLWSNKLNTRGWIYANMSKNKNIPANILGSSLLKNSSLVTRGILVRNFKVLAFKAVRWSVSRAHLPSMY